MLQIYKYNINIIVYFDNLTLNILFFFNSQEIKNYFPKSFYKIYKAHEPCAPTIFSYPYGSSANHLASPKIRMATQQTAWRAQKQVWQNCPTSYGSREVASFAGIAEGYADESV